MKIYVSGKLVPEKDAKVSVFDHGLLYGDGVFEGIRIYNGRVFMLEEHIDRLYDSAKYIRLEIPMTKKALIAAVVKTCKANKSRNGYIRLVVTRGPGNLGLNPFTCKKPEIIIIAANIQLYPKEIYEKGMKVITVCTLRNHNEAMSPNVKSLNYLNNIMAKIEGLNAGCVEAIMMNTNGTVAEATGDNVFAIKDDIITTPPPTDGLLIGITRNVVIKLARENGYEVREASLSRFDLYTADEVFLTGTAAEVVGITSIDSRVIGKGVPGDVTRRLEQLFKDYAGNTGYPIY